MGRRKKAGQLRGLSDKTSDIILVVICLVIVLLVAYPLYYVLIASVSNPYDVYAGKHFYFQASLLWMGTKQYLRIRKLLPDISTV